MDIRVQQTPRPLDGEVCERLLNGQWSLIPGRSNPHCMILHAHFARGGDVGFHQVWLAFVGSLTGKKNGGMLSLTEEEGGWAYH